MSYSDAGLYLEQPVEINPMNSRGKAKGSVCYPGLATRRVSKVGVQEAPVLLEVAQDVLAFETFRPAEDAKLRHEHDVITFVATQGVRVAVAIVEHNLHKRSE